MLASVSTPDSFIGGMRGAHGANATWPLARLTAHPSEGVTVRLRRGFSWFPGLKPVRYRWPEVDYVEQIRGGLGGSTGVRLVGHDGRRVVFWTWRPDHVLRALERFGVAVTTHKRPPRIWIRP